MAQRLVIGMFTLHPAGGQVGVGQSQTINIDCVAESLGKIEEVCYPNSLYDNIHCTIALLGCGY